MDRKISYKSANLFYQEGDYQEALGLYLKILDISSPNEKLLILVANCYDFLGEKELAIKFYNKAYKLNKFCLVALVNMAIVYYEIGQYSKSYKYASKALDIDKDNSLANFVIGNIYNQKKEYQNAISFYQKSLEKSKNLYLVYITMANTYFELNDYKKAAQYAKEANLLDLQKSSPFTLLGNIYKELENYESAIVALQKAISLDENDVWAINYLSQVYQGTKKNEEALKFAYQAVVKSSGDDAHHLNMGYMLYELSETNPDLVKEYANRWLERYGNNEIVLHMANSVLHNRNIDTASPEYLKKTFDVFASDFENVLEGLEYRAPELIYQTLMSVYGQNPNKMKILDAGCGTGLCGKYLKNFSKFWGGLHGVDISAKMLDVAREKKIYNKLFEEEIVSFLSINVRSYDLIVASDVFTYFGDLNKLFASIYFSLHGNGRVVFTIAENDVDDSGYLLHSSGRFLHNKSYVEQILLAKNFKIEVFSREWLRNEGNQKVFGYVVCAYKKAH